MPDNWGFVAAAYAFAVVVFGSYWRRLARRERELTALSAAVRNDRSRRRPPAATAPPRPEADTRQARP